MGTELTSTLLIRDKSNFVDALDISSPDDKFRHEVKIEMTNGAGSYLVDDKFHDRRLVTVAAPTDDLDLSGSLSNYLGKTISFLTVKKIIVQNLGVPLTDETGDTFTPTSGETILVGGAGGSAFNDLFDGDDNAVVKIPSGGSAVFVAPIDGWAVVGGADDILRIAHAGNGVDDIAYNIIIEGETNTAAAPDISGGYYANKSLDVSEEVTGSLVAWAWKDDELKGYALEQGPLGNQAAIYQYGFTTAGDLETGSYDSVSLDLTDDLNGQARGLLFKSDGTKFLVITTTHVMGYTMSVAWDLSTATLDDVDGFDLQTEYGVAVGGGCHVKSDGTKLYVCMTGATNYVERLSFAVAWDETTLSDDDNTFSVLSEETNPWALELSVDGTKSYVGGPTFDKIHQYSNPAAFSIEDAEYDSKSLSVLAQTTQMIDLCFSDDETKFYVTGAPEKKIFQYFF